MPAALLSVEENRTRKTEEKIMKRIGTLALVLALDRAMKNLNGGDSVYNHRGLLIL